MSDRSAVSVIVPTLLVERVIALIETYDGHPDEQNKYTVEKDFDLELTELVYLDCKDGWLKAIDRHDVLKEAGIPFSFYGNEAGDNPAGYYHGRIMPDGSYHQTEVVTGNVAPDPDAMLKLIDQGRLVELATLIKDHLKGTHPISWETQIEPVKKLAAELLLEG